MFVFGSEKDDKVNRKVVEFSLSISIEFARFYLHSYIERIEKFEIS